MEYSSGMATRLKRIGLEERRARLAVRHHLVPGARARGAVEAARGVVCLHGTDPATVFLSALARMKRPEVAAVEQALYEERALLRMLAMRRTMFVVPVEDAPVLQAAASNAVARRERTRNEQIAGMLGVKSPKRWLRDAERAALAALEARGEATAAELSRDVPALGRKLRVNVGKKYEGDIGMAGRILLLLAAEGRVVRARPRGTWISSQYRWTTVGRWLGGPLAELSADDARATLVQRWLARFGPGTENDLQWWTGLPLRELRAAVARVGAVEVELDEGRGLVLPDDLAPTRKPAPWVALLPALDPTTMGWKDRAWTLGAHGSMLFDTNGNAGPTIWADGRIVGGWAVRPGGALVTKLLEDVGKDAKKAVEAEVARWTTVLAGTVIVPRFPTPLSRQLLAAR